MGTTFAINIMGIVLVGIFTLGFNFLESGTIPLVQSTPELNTEGVADDNILYVPSNSGSIKYLEMQKTLNGLGVPTSTIASILNVASGINGDSSIEFNYDPKSDKIIWLDGSFGTQIEETKRDNIKDSETYQLWVRSINANQYLTEEEKAFIINNYISDWIKDEEYMEPFTIALRLQKLKIEYDPKKKNLERDDQIYGNCKENGETPESSGTFYYTPKRILDERQYKEELTNPDNRYTLIFYRSEEYGGSTKKCIRS